MLPIIGEDTTSLEFDIKEALVLSNNDMRLRWKELYNIIYQKNSNQFADEYVFKTTFIRNLKFLVKKGDLSKDPSSTRKNTYYLIVKTRRSKIQAEVRRNYLTKKIDKIWDNLTPDQQKMMLTNYEETRIEALKSLVKQGNILEKALKK